MDNEVTKQYRLLFSKEQMIKSIRKATGLNVETFYFSKPMNNWVLKIEEKIKLDLIEGDTNGT